MKEKVKVGIAGPGKHAIKSHLAKLLKMRDVEIVGAFDPDISKFDKANEILGTKLKFFNSYQELCFASDAVVICSPDDVHFSQLMIAVEEYGCHVLVEKPILTDQSQAEEFKKLLMSTDKVITTCHPRRFDAMYVYIKELVEKYQKEYGKVEKFEMYFERPVPSENERRNYHDSLLSDHFCHELDYMNYVLGCQDVKVNKVCDLYDEYYAHGWRADKVEFTFNASRKLPKGSPSHEWVYVYFHEDVLRIDNLHPENCWRCRRLKSVDHYGDVTGERLINEEYITNLPKTDHNAKYEALNRNFIDSILGKAEPYLSKDEILMAATLPLKYAHRRN